MSKEEKEKRAAELRKNVAMTEHQGELDDLLKDLNTSVDMVRPALLLLQLYLVSTGNKGVTISALPCDYPSIFVYLLSRSSRLRAPQGLTTSTAVKHFEQFGKNELTPPPKTPWYIKFINEMTGYVIPRPVKL